MSLLLLQLNSDVSPLIRSVFIYHKHNRRVLTNSEAAGSSETSKTTHDSTH
jgi:hypothetical protein